MVFQAAILNVKGAIDSSMELAKDFNYPVCERFGGDPVVIEEG